eukprot:jgi/Hompol1/1355/HPOL_001716-RA
MSAKDASGAPDVDAAAANALAPLAIRNSEVSSRRLSATSAAAQKVTIHQILYDDLPEPYTNKDFLEFLINERCEENLEFVNDVIAYRRLSFPVFQSDFRGKHRRRISVQSPEAQTQTLSLAPPAASTAPSARSSAVEPPPGISNNAILEYAEKLNRGETGLDPNEIAPAVIPPDLSFEQLSALLQKMEGFVEKMLDTYVNSGTPKEINLPGKVKKRLMLEVAAKSFNPSIFDGCVSHLINLLRVQPLQRFLAFVAGGSTTSDAAQTAQTTSPKADLPQTNAIEESDGETRVVTIEQIIANRHANQELMEYLKTQNAEQYLEFINDVNSYFKKAMTIYTNARKGNFVGTNGAGNNAGKKQGDLPRRANTLPARPVSAGTPPSQRIVYDGATSISPNESTKKFSSRTTGVTFDQIELLAAKIRAGDVVDPTAISPYVSMPYDLSSDELEARLKSIKNIIGKIIETYIANGCPVDLGLPEWTRKQIIIEYQFRNYNPDIFLQAIEAVLNRLRDDHYEKFMEFALKSGNSFDFIKRVRTSILYTNWPIDVSIDAQSSGSSAIHSVITSPQAKKDFYEFLKNERAEVYLEFLTDIKDYCTLASSVFVTRRRQSRAMNPKSGLTRNPILIPETIKRPLLASFEGGNYSPSVFTAVIAYIVDVQLKSPYERFTNPRASTATPFAIAGRLSVAGSPIKEEEPEQVLTTPLTKVTLDKVISNPHTNKDLLRFLVDEHCSENLEFVNAVDAYFALSRLIYPVQSGFLASIQSKGQTGSSPLGKSSGSPADPSEPKDPPLLFHEIEKLVEHAKTGSFSSASKLVSIIENPDLTHEEIELRLVSMEAAIVDIVQTFIVAGSPKEVNIPATVRRDIITKFGERNYHPSIFLKAAKHTIQNLRQPFAAFL